MREAQTCLCGGVTECYVLQVHACSLSSGFFAFLPEALKSSKTLPVLNNKCTRALSNIFSSMKLGATEEKHDISASDLQQHKYST